LVSALFASDDFVDFTIVTTPDAVSVALLAAGTSLLMGRIKSKTLSA
jgi:hypothetical protein